MSSRTLETLGVCSGGTYVSRLLRLDFAGRAPGVPVLRCGGIRVRARRPRIHERGRSGPEGAQQHPGVPETTSECSPVKSSTSSHATRFLDIWLRIHDLQSAGPLAPRVLNHRGLASEACG